jgi:hypothetical protein
MGLSQALVRRDCLHDAAGIIGRSHDLAIALAPEVYDDLLESIVSHASFRPLNVCMAIVFLALTAPFFLQPIGLRFCGGEAQQLSVRFSKSSLGQIFFEV